MALYVLGLNTTIRIVQETLQPLWRLKSSVLRPGMSMRWLAMLMLLLPGLWSPLKADHLLPTHELNCSTDFPCPDALFRRINFWVEVMEKWTSNDAILHDPDVPERVYQVVHTSGGKGCSSSVLNTVKQKKETIEQSLLAIADKLEHKQPIRSKWQRHLLELFEPSDADEIRSAAERIRCQSGISNNFKSGINRMMQYRTMVKKVFKAAGLASDFVYLPLVESTYNPRARSKAGAAGMWQIMPSTARNLGLTVNSAVDQRYEPEAATRAAARYLLKSDTTLRQVALEFTSQLSAAQLNPFVVTSYNYGLNGMQRAMRQTGPDFLLMLEQYRSPSFRVAVKNFYASFLAARHLALKAERTGAGSKPAKSLKTQTVRLKNATSVKRITRVFGIKTSELKKHNLALTRSVWRGTNPIPAGYRLGLPYRSHKWQQQTRKLLALKAESFAPKTVQYRVRRGDTACGIAQRYRVSCRDLIRVNRLGRKAIVKTGQRLSIPTKGGVSRVKTTIKSSRVSRYTVKAGDTACGIAEKFKTSCRDLIRTNRLGKKAGIRVGQKLVVQTPAKKRYTVKSGDTACGIARRFKVGCSALISLNRLGRKAVVRVGQKLRIP